MSSALISVPPPLAMGIMKGPSSHQIGEEITFTITCYTCGMPSSKEWAQRVHTRPRSIPGRPFYPFLTEFKSAPAGAHISVQDGTTFLCAFCQASLEAQWISFENRNILVKDRQYSLNSFICSVCSIETYRKRVRALPFQEFPFLTKERPRGSLTLGKSPLAVVCLDCSETLWAQSSEYDRWGLPIQKRHFNWMSRPPPPENSMEATVARLPSGETQLPRCPPTEPLVVPRRKEQQSYNGVPPRNPVSELGIPISSSQSQNHNQVPPRRPLVTELLGKGTSPDRSISSKSPSSGKSPSRSIPDPHALLLQGGGVPVVTVAPMTSFATTSTNSIIHREPTTLVGLTNLPHLDALRHSHKSEIHPANGLSASLLTSNINYGTFNPWGGTSNHLEHFPYPPPPLTGLESLISGSIHQGSKQFPWIPTSTITNPDYVRYQAYLSAVAGNNYKSAVETYFSQPHPHPLLQTTESVTSSDVPINHSLSRTVNTNRSRTTSNSSPRPVVQGVEGKYFANSSILKSQPEDVSSRKRLGLPTGPLSLPKMPHLQNSSSMKPSSEFVSIPRLSRHLDPGKGVERNRNYIQSVSAIVNELEMSRPRSGRNGNDPFSTLSPQKRKQALEDVNGAMDLSLMRALKTPRTEALSCPRSSTNLYHTISRERRPNSAFLIENLCSENMSPRRLESGRRSAPQSPYTQDQGEGEPEGRNSVIVKAKIPSRFGQSRSPVNGSPTPVEAAIKDEVGTIPNARIISTIRSPLHFSDASVVNTHNTRASPRTNGNSPILPLVSEVQSPRPAVPVESDAKFQRVPTETSKIEQDKLEGVNLTKEVSSVVISTMAEKDEDQIIAESIMTFKKERADRIAKLQEVNDAKEQFLRFLELVPPKEKNEIDLKILFSRYKRKTLPPIQLRVAEAEEESMSEEVEKHLLLTAFDDPSLKQGLSNPKLVDFMTNLDMKTASKAEKYRREEVWRLKLAERIARLKRERTLSGEKKPWDMTDGIILKHLLPNGCGGAGAGRTRRHSLPPVSERTLPRLYRSLSVTLPPDPMSYGSQSSDLLTTVDDKESKELNVGSESVEQEPTVSLPNRMGMNNENLEKILKLTHRGRSPVITYPKYVPSYATTVPEKRSPGPQASPDDPNGKIPPGADTENKESVPLVVTPRASTPLTTNHDENGIVQVSPSSTIDGIIQRSSNCWKETKDEIEHLLKIKSESKTGKRIPPAELKRLRKSINAQQLEMKGMVKWLKQLAPSE